MTEERVERGSVDEKGDVLRQAIAAYGLGEKLRRLRLRKKISLADLGLHTGLSASLLSQLENGKLVPTLPTLVRIAMVFDVGLDYFFSTTRDEKLFCVVRARDRIRLPERANSPSPGYFFECLAYSAKEKALQAYYAEFPARESPSDEHVHEGSEMLYVIRGAVAVRARGEEHTLETGDAVYFDASEPHSYRGAGPDTAAAVVVTAPPRL